MAILDILSFPDKRLRHQAKAVTVVNDRLRRLGDDMLETMYAAPGIGLAAVQINVPERLIVVDVSADQSQPLMLVNPEITHVEGVEEMDEGCLSVPGVFESVQRAAAVTVKALNRDGKPMEIDAEGLLAVCIQHEIDHLDGRLFIDYLSELKRQRIRKRMVKQQGAEDSGARKCKPT